MFKAINQKTRKTCRHKAGNNAHTVKRKAEGRCSVAHCKRMRGLSMYFTFRGPCIVMHSYNKTNEMH